MALNNHNIDNKNNCILEFYGFLFPSSEEQLNKFNSIFIDYKPELLGKKINSDKLFKEYISKINNEYLKKCISKTKLKIKNDDNSSTPKSIEYYKRMLLAAEIVNELHNEPTLGHVKLQKLIYLCQKINKIKLPTNFLKQAAGPYDPKMMRSIDIQLEKKGWFKYNPNELLKYKPLVNFGLHQFDFRKYFVNEIESIYYIINLFRLEKTDFIEIIATLYACWENILINRESFSEKLLFSKFYLWSQEKRKYNLDRLQKSLKWMIDHSIVP